MDKYESFKRKQEKFKRNREMEQKKLLKTNFLINPPEEIKTQSQSDQSTEQSKIEHKKPVDNGPQKLDEIRTAVDRLNTWDKNERLKTLPPRQLSSKGEDGLHNIRSDLIAEYTKDEVVTKYANDTKSADRKKAIDTLKTEIREKYSTELSEREIQSLAKAPFLKQELKQNQDEMRGLQKAQAYLDQFKEDLKATETTSPQDRKVVDNLLKDINLLKKSFDESHSERGIRVDHLKTLLRISDSKEIKEPKKMNEVNKLTDIESDSKLTKLKKLSETQEQQIKALTEKIGILDGDITKITDEKSKADILHKEKIEEKDSEISKLAKQLEEDREQLKKIAQEKFDSEKLHMEQATENDKNINYLEETINNIKQQLTDITQAKFDLEKLHMEQTKTNNSEITELQRIIKDTQNQLTDITQAKSDSEKLHMEQLIKKDDQISQLTQKVQDLEQKLQVRSGILPNKLTSGLSALFNTSSKGQLSSETAIPSSSQKNLSHSPEKLFSSPSSSLTTSKKSLSFSDRTGIPITKPGYRPSYKELSNSRKSTDSTAQSFEDQKKENWENLYKSKDNIPTDVLEDIRSKVRTKCIEKSEKITTCVKEFFDLRTQIVNMEDNLVKGKRLSHSVERTTKGLKQIEMENLEEADRTIVDDFGKTQRDIYDAMDDDVPNNDDINDLNSKLMKIKPLYDDIMKKVEKNVNDKVEQDPDMQKLKGSLKIKEYEMLAIILETQVSVTNQWGDYKIINDNYHHTRQDHIIKALSGDELTDAGQMISGGLSRREYPLGIVPKANEPIKEKIERLVRDHIDLIIAKTGLTDTEKFSKAQEGRLLNELQRKAKELQEILDKMKSFSEKKEINQEMVTQLTETNQHDDELKTAVNSNQATQEIKLKQHDDELKTAVNSNQATQEIKLDQNKVGQNQQHILAEAIQQIITNED